jgi:hypothetical protein
MARRSFLRGCGGAAGLLMPLLRSIEARAQGLPAPLRLLIIHHPMGTWLDLWRPAAPTTTTSFTLPANSAPFAPLQSKMVMVDGVNLVTASHVPSNSGGQNSGEGGMVALMTGVPTLGQIGQQDHAAGGMSIDQLFLDRSPVLGGASSSSATKTPFQSLQLAADIRSDRDEIAPRVMSYRPPIANADINSARQPMYPETQPLAVFNRLFGAGLPPGTHVADLLARELSVLDFMRSDLSHLRGLIPASEKPKLEIHAAAIQQLEATLRASLSGSAGGEVCLAPALPPMFPQTGTGASGSLGPPGGSRLRGVDYYVPGDPTNHPHQILGRTHLALIKAAFLCDLVRVATFSWAPHGSWVVFPGAFGGVTLTVAGSAPASAPAHPPSNTLEPGVQAWLAAIDAFYAAETSQAIQEFAAVSDLDGNKLLDNTVIPYVSEVARTWDHNQMNVPLAIFGGKNTRVKGGTFLKVTDGSLPMQTGMTTSGGTGNRPFNDVWLALAPVFGVDLPTLGAGTQYTGPLPGLIA